MQRSHGAVQAHLSMQRSQSVVQLQCRLSTPKHAAQPKCSAAPAPSKHIYKCRAAKMQCSSSAVKAHQKMHVWSKCSISETQFS
eukprot:1157294-Pelagomonas_calceolata.AAC.2